ncbi:helix-turn-helix transcriptional regulator [Dyadobacter sp. CY326]|uniref:helix-turn-helix transcriptional regulator n=1 Tax=Dyadobacter sp. CY326 TaxID=2907300 RepID=UPI001F276C5F|nr:helix-turn-helix transcriptional regulator [Dyadobacter sp. CY326]MCE7064764.1 helix-turn-helix domain-containing protein [Dyadobacter sp. CY326]
MDLNDKIKQILADKHISPSLFADEVGIQRSSMSHILAGRNKPSLDIVQKIVKRYPELGTNWILDDEDVPMSAMPSESNSAIQYPSMRGTKNNAAQSVVINAKTEVEPKNVAIKNEQAPERKVDKVLIFYSDGTFEEFKRAN